MTVPETYRAKRGAEWQRITSHMLQRGIDFEGREAKPRVVSKWLRRERYLKPESRGKVMVNVYADRIDVLLAYNMEPLFVFELETE